MTTNEHVRDIHERGFSVWEQCWSEAEVATLRSAIVSRLQEERDLPAQLWSETDYAIDDSISMSYTGLVIFSIVRDRPEIASLVLKPEVIAALRGVLGNDMALDGVGAVVTDETRPFICWHAHIGGHKGGEYKNDGNWPVIETADRITTLLYLDDIDDDGGLLIVYPRTVGSSTAPPMGMDPNVEPWPGQVEVRARRGSLVALEQCTYHTARPMRRAGRRVFLGCSFRAARVPAPEWAQTNSFASLLPPI